MPMLPPVLSFVAPSGTGKTTLLERVIAQLTRRGLRVAVLKHDAHRLELDKKGKDTWRFRQAGAWRAVIAGQEQMAAFSSVDGELTVAGLVDGWLSGADIVLTEGFRRSSVPMIRVHRQATADPTWEPPASPIAWVSDVAITTDVPVLSLDDPTAVADFVIAKFLHSSARARQATLALPMGQDTVAADVAALAERLAGVAAETIVVHPRGVKPPPGLASVQDIRPDVGPLGALLTALAASNTPNVLLVGARHRDVSRGVVEGLLRWGPRRADVVAPVANGFHEPLLACYGHRCLPAIHAALISGEAKMDGWWGQVRVHEVGPETWLEADDSGAGVT